MKKTLSLVLTMCMVLSLFATFVISASADDVVTWEDGQIKDPADESGRNWKFDNAYGYTFVIDADKKIGGEDNVLIETVDEYKACNPNWAISVLLKPAGDLYEVVTVVVTPGDADKGIAAGIAIENGNIVLVAHSSASYSAEDADPAKDFDADGNYKYFNWQTKLAAIALKAGDKVKVADDKSSVYVLIPGVDDKEETGTVLVKGDNVALNQKYTISEQFRMGGADVDWGWDPNASISYPDDGVKLTDGVKDPGDNAYTNPVWAGFSYLTPSYKEIGYHTITVDLGETKDLYEVSITLATKTLTAGIGVENSSVQFFGSNDGETWEAISDVVVPVDTDAANFVEVSAKVKASAKYVQARLVRDGWLFVSEVEVFEAVAGTGEIVKEEITVDGALTDNGWAADKWTNVTGDNGTWQQQSDYDFGKSVCPEFTYKYQMRADETKLYVAVEFEGEPVDGKATQLRFWIRDNDEATVYTSFYDVFFTDGAVSTLAKYNTSTTSNSGAEIADTTFTAAAKTEGGKTVIEFSIDVAEFTADGSFDYYICLAHKVGDNSGTLYYPAVPYGPTSEEGGEAHKPHIYFPWNAWAAENDATVNVEDIALGEIVVGGETDDNLGDAGIYVIAALAVVALIGTAIVIKKRA